MLRNAFRLRLRRKCAGISFMIVILVIMGVLHGKAGIMQVCLLF